MHLAQQPRKLGWATCRIKVSIFIIESLVAHQFSDFFSLKSSSAVLELFRIKELDLSDTNQQRGSTDSTQTTSGIAQFFQNTVKNTKGANVK